MQSLILRTEKCSLFYSVLYSDFLVPGFASLWLGLGWGGGHIPNATLSPLK